MTVYITGANGRLGKYVMEALPSAIPLSRRPILGRKGVYTTYKRSQLEKIFRRGDVVIHLAGSMKFDDEGELWRGNVEVTENIVDALGGEGKVIFASSIAVYGKKLSTLPADEHTPVNPDSPYAKTKLEAEKIVLKYPHNCVLRLSTLYGRDYEDYFKMIKIVDRGFALIFGNGKNRIPFLHVGDAALAFKRAYLSNARGIYVIAGEALEQEKIYDLLASLLERRVWKIKLPPSLAERIVRIFWKDITKEHIAVLTSDRVFNTSKAERELGWKSRKLEKGLAEMVEEYVKKYKRLGK